MNKISITLFLAFLIGALSLPAPAVKDGTNPGKDVAFSMATAPKAKTLYTFVGENDDQVIMECYNDGTCAILQGDMGIVTKGTWILDMTCQTPAWWIRLDDVFPGLDIHIDTDYMTKYTFKFKDISGELEETFVLPFATLV